MFSVPGITLLLLRGSYDQLENCWLPPTQGCHYFTFMHTLIQESLLWFSGITVGVDKMPSSLPWEFAQVFQVLWKPGHRKKAFMLYPNQVILVLCFKYEVSFAKGLTFNFREATTRKSNSLYCFKVSETILINNLIRGFSCLVL